MEMSVLRQVFFFGPTFEKRRYQIKLPRYHYKSRLPSSIFHQPELSKASKKKDSCLCHL